VAIATLMAVSLPVLFCVPLMEHLNLEMFSQLGHWPILGH
jgi:hypothetical protein